MGWSDPAEYFRCSKKKKYAPPNNQSQIKLLTVRGDTAQKNVNGKAQEYPKLHQSPPAAQDGWAAEPALPDTHGSESAGPGAELVSGLHNSHLVN